MTRCHLIDNEWSDGDGTPLSSTDPATGRATWTGCAATDDEVDRAVRAARNGLAAWHDRPPDRRAKLLRSLAERFREGRDDLVRAICEETGKPRWESDQEVDAMIGKIGISIDSFEKRRSAQTHDIGGTTGTTRFKPHGVVSVLGPFNLPGHLPHGQIVPALLAGNTVVFKPSEQAPRVAEQMLERWLEVDPPAGVLNLVQGGAATGRSLAQHDGVDGLFFTGSYSVGQALGRALADRPEKILVMEMGGNNPLFVHGAGDVDAAVCLTVLSAFITAGQRCTCARRLIVVESNESDRFLARLVDAMGRIRIGAWTDEPQPFYGPVISTEAAGRLLRVQERLTRKGARILVEMKRRSDCPALLSPGLIDVTGTRDRDDEEWFGPLLHVIRVADVESAIDEANNTRYGLAAALLSDDAALYEEFRRRVRAGIVNWNRQTTGASGRLPFGGVGRSGNHRPAGYFTIDHCAYPVASLETPRLEMPPSIPPGTQG